MMRYTQLLSLCIIAVLVTACGNNRTDRALSGAGIGAGAGAIAGAITGGSATTGALIGAGLGAAGGGLTDQKDVDLGKPIWK
jgi:osmotically inducible lipoprotein OsmB